MVRRRNKFPETGEAVIGTVKTVNPYSAFVHLDEYGCDGMVHVSEVARKWVRDIRSFVKEKGTVVCVVMNVDEAKGHVTLSMKRLSDRDKNRRLQEWKRDEKGEKLLEKAAEKRGITLDQAYEEVGFDIQDSFRDMLEAFETAQKEVDLLERKGIPKEWAATIRETADENIEIREKAVGGVLEVQLYAPDAIDKIKESFMEAEKKHGVRITYLSAPNYSITYSSTNPKKADKTVTAAAEEIIADISKAGGKGAYKPEKQ